MSITIFATLSVKPGKADEALAELKKMLEPSRAEPGCQRYEIYRAAQDGHILHMLETFDDHGAMEAHSQSAYFRQMVEKITPLLEREFDIRLITRLE